MSERAVFLDRDNTIIENDGYLGDPSKVKLLPGAATALASLRALGYRLIVVSNQSGVARGMFKETDVEAVNDEMGRQLRQQAGAYVDASYYCPFHAQAPVAEYRVDHEWRKPKPGMLKQAATDFNLDLTQCWMVGDSWRDVAAGAAAGCRTIRLRDPERKIAGEDPEPAGTAVPSFVVRALPDAARIIVRERRQPQPPPPPPLPAPAPAKDEPPPAPTPAPPPIAAAPAPVSPAPAPLNTDALAEKLAEILAGKIVVQIPAPPPPPPPPAPTSALPEAAAPQPSPALAAPLTPGGPLERHLDELVVQLRQQNRNADLRPDFSMSHIAVMITEAFALLSVAIGFFKYFTMKVSFETPQELQFTTMAHLQSLIWIMIALFLQGVVITILIFARQR